MKHRRTAFAGLLVRLLRDRQGNTLVLAAALVLPMLILAASVVDISRLYMTKSRLQSACDAGALAGRKAMNGITWAAANETTARNFFNANFPDGIMTSNSRSITFSVDGSGNVSATATAILPPTVTKIIGAGNTTLTVNCKAEMQLPNTDIMFALDTTGSMSETNPGDSVSRISALRTAVQNFYTTLQSNVAGGATLRYGFVPFSSTVNVGYLLKREWMVDSATYQSRVTDGTSTSSGTTSSTTNYSAWTTLSGSSASYITYGSAENCVAPSNTYSYSDSTTSSSSPYPGGGTQTTVTRTRTENGSAYSTAIVSGACRITETRYSSLVTRRTETTIPVGSSYTSTNYYWTYRPVSYDVSGLKGNNANGLMAGGYITAMVGNNHTSVNATWSGCIEERGTTYISSYSSIPSSAYDMDIDLVPTTDDATRWRPFLPRLVFVRRSTSNWDVNTVAHVTNNYTRADSLSNASVCPAQARKLATMTSTEVTNYVNALSPGGYTYLDIGMLWAARLISSTGLFASENNDAPNISRHIIFMTDGEINTILGNYEAYGLAALDRRRTQNGVAPTNSMIDGIVSDRFDALCTATKAKGITIWVVAFGTTLNDQLRNCSSGGRAYAATNASELNSAFQNIASRIAQLRITQ